MLLFIGNLPDINSDMLTLLEFSCDPINKPVSQDEFRILEKFLDKLWSSLGVDVALTKHFMERVNDERNRRQITLCELANIFKAFYKTYSKQIIRQASNHKDMAAIINSVSTDINIPVKIRWNETNKTIDMVAATIMRKPNFVAPPQERVMKVEKAVVKKPSTMN